MNFLKRTNRTSAPKTKEANTDTDDNLVARLQDPKTCRTAFSEVINRFSEPLYWQIRRMVQSHEDANDLLQNTFLKAWSAIDQFRGTARLSTWLYKIAINESLTFLEQQRRRHALSLDAGGGKDDDVTPLIAQIEADSHFDGEKLDMDFRKAIANLPEKQRLVFNMRYFDEIPYEEMSHILGTSVGALKASYHLAVKKIEQFIRNID